MDADGYYAIVDRRKELIKFKVRHSILRLSLANGCLKREYKGFQVPPAELESVLLQHPDIVDAAVIGINSEAEATELPR